MGDCWEMGWREGELGRLRNRDMLEGSVCGQGASQARKGSLFQKNASQMNSLVASECMDQWPVVHGVCDPECIMFTISHGHIKLPCMCIQHPEQP